MMAILPGGQVGECTHGLIPFRVFTNAFGFARFPRSASRPKDSCKNKFLVLDAVAL
jgi:hypothetical protein